jgi:hypothetical protein
MQAGPPQVTPPSSSNSLEHVSELMATSSGDVGVEVEEEVEYIEEVVEYEDEEVIEEEEESEENDDQVEEQAPASGPAGDATVEPESEPADPKAPAPAEQNKDVEEAEPQIPPSSSAQELPVKAAPSHAGPSEPGESNESTAVGAVPDASAGGSKPAGTAGVDLDFKQLEAQAAKVRFPGPAQMPRLFCAQAFDANRSCERVAGREGCIPSRSGCVFQGAPAPPPDCNRPTGPCADAASLSGPWKLAWETGSGTGSVRGQESRNLQQQAPAGRS